MNENDVKRKVNEYNEQLIINLQIFDEFIELIGKKLNLNDCLSVLQKLGEDLDQWSWFNSITREGKNCLKMISNNRFRPVYLIMFEERKDDDGNKMHIITEIDI